MNRVIQALDPTIQRYIAQGFLIEHGQKISAADVEQLEMPNAKYYVSVAMAANQDTRTANAKIGVGWQSKLRSKRVVFGSTGAGLAVLVLFITVVSGGSPEKAANSGVKSPTTSAMTKVTDLNEAASAVDRATEDISTPPATTPTPTPAPTPSTPRTATSVRAGAILPTPTPAPVTPPTPTPEPIVPAPEPAPTPAPTPPPTPPEPPAPSCATDPTLCEGYVPPEEPIPDPTL